MRRVSAIELPGGYNLQGPAENAAAQDKGFFAGLDKITIGAIVSQTLPIIFAVAGIILFLYFLAAGIQLITSGGEPKAVEAAKARISNAVIGAVVIVLAYLIIKFIQATLQIG
jgi:hypothetical protein